jgi:hypothetical protein
VKFGEVVLWKDFRFPNGNIRNKLGVCLNRPNDIFPAVLAFTTSTVGRYPNTPGCHADPPSFFFKRNPSQFPDDTWIVLSRVYPLPLPVSDKMKASGAMVRLNQLRQDQACALRNCALNSDDIEGKIIDLIRRSS